MEVAFRRRSWSWDGSEVGQVAGSEVTVPAERRLKKAALPVYPVKP